MFVHLDFDKTYQQSFKGYEIAKHILAAAAVMTSSTLPSDKKSLMGYQRLILTFYYVTNY